MVFNGQEDRSRIIHHIFDCFYQHCKDIFMDQHKRAVIIEVIEKLKSLLKKRREQTSAPVVPSQTQPQIKQQPKKVEQTSSPPPNIQAAPSVSIEEFDSNFSKCWDQAQKTSPELVKLTQVYGSASKIMKNIIAISRKSAKFNSQQQNKLKNKIQILSKELDQLQQQKQVYTSHCRAFKQMIHTTLWVFSESPAFIFKRSIMSADYWANQFQNKHDKSQNQWYSLFHDSVKSLQKYAMENHPNGLVFGNQQSNSWDLLIEDRFVQTAPPIVPKQNVEKKQEKVAAPAGKQPKKEIAGQMCTVMNYENDKVELGAGEIKMMTGIFFENSKHTHLKVDAKFKSIVISKCEDIVLEMKSCISGIEIINCSNVRIYVHEKTPSISADTSQSVAIVLNEQNLECDIVSSKTSELTVAYRKADQSESKAVAVSSQLVTKWDPESKQFKTTVYDKFL